MPKSKVIRTSAILGFVFLLGGAIGFRVAELRLTAHSLDRRIAVPTAAEHSGASLERSAPEKTAWDDGDDWQHRWSQVRAEKLTDDSEARLRDLIRDLAAHDPQRALALVGAERNWRLRQKLRDAALQGWAEGDVNAAAMAAMSLQGDDRVEAVSAVIAGACHDPAAAAALVSRISDRDPSRMADYGAALIAALEARGNFSAAVDFVSSRPASPLRLEQADTAFDAWAEREPERALAAIGAIDDPDLRKAAFHGTMLGWSMADPIAAANYAAGLAPGEERAVALANAIPRWVQADPLAATKWLGEHDTSADFDQGVIAVATMPAMITDRPDVAMSLAQSISDVPLRTNTLRNIALKWAEADPPAAVRYVQSSSNFSPDERSSILAEIGQSTGG